MSIRDYEQEIQQHEQAIQAAMTAVAESRARAAEHADAYSKAVSAHYEGLLSQNSQLGRGLAPMDSPCFQSSWNEEAWRTWVPEVIAPPSFIVAGELSDVRSPDFRVPFPIPFIGEGCTVVIPSAASEADAAIEAMHAIVIRALAMLPHQVRFTFVDPARQGRAFPMIRSLPQGHVRMSTSDVVRDLDEVRRDIDQINATYIDKETPSFEKLPNEVRLRERFELIFIAEYPEGFDRRAIEALRQISRNGPPAGKYLFVHRNVDLAGPRDVNLDDLTRTFMLPIDGRSPYQNYRVSVSRAPQPRLERTIHEKLASVKPPERKLGWNDIVRPRDSEIWALHSEVRVETPVGGAGTNQVVKIWFGVNDEGSPCAHGVLGAMPGAGKSNLYHVLIMGLATRYSPEELRLYLIDGKFGVEFQDYRELPHADVVSLHTPPELSRSVLSELIQEMERRNTLFSRAGVVDLKGYRLAQPEHPLPRILLLVDEYQELFEGDRDGVASAQILQLAQQARSSGIHMLLGSQKFGVPGLMNQAAVMGAIHLRIAMQLPHDAVQALTEFGREGRRQIAGCDLPGKVVINDHSGDDSGNVAGKVAFLEPELRRHWIGFLKQKAAASLPEEQCGRGVVCDGESQPLFIENPLVRAELRRPGTLLPTEREAMARRPYYEGGFDTDDWYSGERPHVMWLGQEFNVHGHSRIILRRRPAESAVIVGGSPAARFGMFASSVLSVALISSPDAVRVHLLDRSIPEMPWYQTLNQVAGLLDQHGYAITFSRGAEEGDRQIESAAAEVDRRRSMPETAVLSAPSEFLFLAEADRVRSLDRKLGRLGLEDSELGKRLNTVIVEGPSVGVHVVLGFGGYVPLTRTIDPRRLEHIRHRIALQSGEDDSFNLVRSRKAALLQANGKTPIAALYCDMVSSKETRFKPYAVDDRAGWPVQLETISGQMQRWRMAHGNG